jgi:branched-chain amino acid transport system ATP-binding protein
MLEIKNINTGYGPVQVLFDISMKVESGQIVAIIGPNGSGKSTVLKTVSGLLPVWKGDILFNGNSIRHHSTVENIVSGMTFCPQGNRVFDELTVLENLEIGGYTISQKEINKRIDEVLSVFPALKERLTQSAGKLSGGEQQMLSLARALVPKPKMLLLDEPSLGLAPNLLGILFKKLADVNKSLGVSMLIVEQKVMNVLSISSKVYGIKLGRIAYEGRPEELRKSKDKLKSLFL